VVKGFSMSTCKPGTCGGGDASPRKATRLNRRNPTLRLLFASGCACEGGRAPVSQARNRTLSSAAPTAACVACGVDTTCALGNRPAVVALAKRDRRAKRRKVTIQKQCGWFVRCVQCVCVGGGGVVGKRLHPPRRRV
jgi:hypothetical protein